MSRRSVEAPEDPPAFRQAPRGRELARILRRRRHLRSDLVQLLAAIAAVALAFTVPHIPSGFTVPTSRAIEMLIAVAAGTVTFIGVVFGLLFLVVQFSSTTFTPRLNLFRDAPIVWRAFALYSSVVVYSFTAALVIGGEDQTSGFVPILAFAGIVVSIFVYRRLQLSAFRSIQLSAILAQVARRGRDVIDGLYTLPVRIDGRAASPSEAHSSQGADEAEEGRIRWSHPAVVLQVIDVPRILRAAERAGAVVQFTVGVGSPLAEGATIANATPPVGKEVEHDLLKALTVGEERTFEQDPELALRLLADIALRALSPAVNDPTTAVQAIDTMDALLRRLALRDLDIGRITAGDGTVRVILVLPTWEDYLATALDEIIALPAPSPAIVQRVARLLDDLREIAPPARHPALDRRRATI